MAKQRLTPQMFSRGWKLKQSALKKAPKKVKHIIPQYSHITLEEVQAQIAVGSIKPQTIAGLVTMSDDKNLINWALSHRLASVRIAAVEHEFCPFGQLIEKLLSDSAITVRNASRRALNKRSQEVKLFLELLYNYPQFTLSLRDTHKSIKIVDDEGEDNWGGNDEEDPPF